MSKTVLTLYRDFHDLYARANSNLSKGQAHDEANLKWNSMKKGGVLDQEAYNVEVNTLKSKLRKRKLTMFDFVNNKKQPCVLSTPQPHAPPDSSASTSISGDSTASKSVSSSAQTTSTTLTNPVTETDSSNLVENQAGPSGEASTETTNADELSVLEGDNDAATRDTPAQTKIKEELEAVNKQLVKLNEARNLGLGEETNAGLVKQIKDETAKKNALQRKLDLTEQWRKNSKRARDKKKTAIKNAEKDFPGLSERVNSSIYRESTGRPCLEEQYPNLHKDILEIATIGAAASDRRRQETFRSVKTLADLHNALSDLGYKISKRALYQRLLPKGVSATEAKKHVRTVPVR